MSARGCVRYRGCDKTFRYLHEPIFSLFIFSYLLLQQFHAVHCYWYDKKIHCAICFACLATSSLCFFFHFVSHFAPLALEKSIYTFSYQFQWIENKTKTLISRIISLVPSMTHNELRVKMREWTAASKSVI